MSREQARDENKVTRAEMMIETYEKKLVKNAEERERLDKSLQYWKRELRYQQGGTRYD